MIPPDWLTARPVAHRGYHDAEAGRVENTLPAISAAVDRNFAIEIDVQLTADNRIVAFHDMILERLTTSHGDVSQLSLASLKEARFRAGDARIPTLDEVLDLVGGRSPLFVDMKSHWQNDGRLIQGVADILSAYDGPVAVTSFDHRMIAAFRKLSPNIARGLVSGRSAPTHWPSDRPLWRWHAYRHLIYAATSRPSFICYRTTSLPASAPLALRHFLQVPLLTFTVDTAGLRSKAHEWSDQIIFEGFDPDAVTLE